MENLNSQTSKIMDRFTQEQLIDIINIFETNSTKKAAPPLYQRYGIRLKEARILYAELVQVGLARDHLKDKWTIEQTNKLKNLVKEGYDITEIAHFFNKTGKTVKNKIIKEFGCIPFIELPGEEWRDSFTLNGYQISNKGRVRDEESNRVYKGGVNANGYPVFKMIPIHRLVAEVFIPNPDNKPIVDHIDTNKTNNDVNNLRWVTQEENMRNEQTRENLHKGKERNRNMRKANSLIEQALELVPDKLELIQLVIQANLPNTENNL